MTIAHAAEAAGIPRSEIIFFSHGNPSPLYGAQFLHGEIPGLHLGPFTIEIHLAGTMPEYQEKVYETYRDGPNVPPEEFAQPRLGWDIREAYQILWDRYERLIVPHVFTKQDFAWNIGELRDNCRYIFTTMPMRQFCMNEDHRWNSEGIYAIGDGPEHKCMIRAPKNSVWYNGLKTPGWYRKANIHGHCTVEWPAHSGRQKPPFSGVVRVEKPLDTDCDYWPDLVRIGRYAEFKKGVLVHDAYERTLKTLTNGVQGVLF